MYLRIKEYRAFSKITMHTCMLSHVRLFATPWAVAHQAPPPGSSIHGILQTRILEWVAISSSRDLPNLGRSNPDLLHLLHWKVNSLPLSHLGSPNHHRYPLYFSKKDHRDPYIFGIWDACQAPFTGIPKGASQSLSRRWQQPSSTILSSSRATIYALCVSDSAFQ